MTEPQEIIEGGVKYIVYTDEAEISVLRRELAEAAGRIKEALGYLGCAGNEGRDHSGAPWCLFCGCDIEAQLIAARHVLAGEPK